jgi:hypothetical protein
MYCVFSLGLLAQMHGHVQYGQLVQCLLSPNIIFGIFQHFFLILPAAYNGNLKKLITWQTLTKIQSLVSLDILAL